MHPTKGQLHGWNTEDLMEEEIANHLNWPCKIMRVTWSKSPLVREVDVYTDFDWLAFHKSRHIRFPNHLSLGEYCRDNKKSGKEATLLLTKREDSREGYIKNHPTRDIFIVKYDTYAGMQRDNPAAAYFAGLRGTHIVDPSDPRTAQVLDSAGMKAFADLCTAQCQSIEQGNSSSTAEEIDGAVSLIDALSAYAIITAPEVDSLGKATVNFALLVASAVEHSRRLAVVKKFEDNLGNKDESFWRTLIRENEWIFGHALEFRYLSPSVDNPLTSDKDIHNHGGVFADVELKSEGSLKFTVFLEIKTPMTELVSKSPTELILCLYLKN